MPTGKLGTGQSFLGSLQFGVLGDDPLQPNISQELGITQNLGPATRRLAQSMFFQQQVNFQLAIGETENIFQNLGLTQEVDPGTVQNITQNLNLIQQILVINFGPIEQNLALDHAAFFVGPVPRSVSNTLAMVQSAVPQFDVPVSVSQNLNIVHQVADVQKQDLNIVQSVFGYKNASPNFRQSLGIGHTVQITAAYNASVSHTSIVSQSVTFWIDDGTSCPRNDFQNWGTLGEEPFTVEVGAKMRFSSLDGSDDVVVLRNPELDDRDRLGQTRINRESRGGELQVYRDPSWPLINTLQGTIVGLKKQDVDDLLQFFEDHLGEEISLNDWHGRYWRGVIVNPDEPAVEDTRGRWTVAFEFEGIELPGPDVLQNTQIDHTLQVIQILNHNPSHDLNLSHEGRHGEEISVSAQNGGGVLVDQEVSHTVV